jgi:short-subunit dehydrogenase
MKTAGREKPSGRALVTGASRGIGKAIAEALVAHGWEVIGTCRAPGRLVRDQKLPGVTYLPLDLGKTASIAALARRVREVDVLVNNAGASAIGPVEEISMQEARALFDTNFFGAVDLTRRLIARMRSKGAGTVIFIGSMHSEAPAPFKAVYSASKAALRSFSDCLRAEVGGFGVRVSLIAPLYIRTNLEQRMHAAKNSPYGEKVHRMHESRQQMISTSADISTVSRKVLEILRNPRPRSFYCVGRAAGLQAFLARHAPRRFLEDHMARRYKLK